MASELKRCKFKPFAERELFKVIGWMTIGRNE